MQKSTIALVITKGSDQPAQPHIGKDVCCLHLGSMYRV